MGCGAGIAYASEGQKEELFTAATKEMMKMCVVDGYLSKDELKVVAPGKPMESARAFSVKLHEASAVAREKCEDTVGSGTDKVNDAAESVKETLAEKGGMLGGLMGSVVAGTAAVVTKTADVAASGTGFLAEKAIKGVALLLDEAIKKIDEPFEAVGKDIFELKKTEIIGKYCSIIEGCRIPKAVECVRGASPWGAAEYAACKPTVCCDTLQSVCQKDILAGLREVVQEEIDKHTVTSVWNWLIEKYNECNAKLSEYEILKDFIGEPIKLDIGEYIVAETASQFHGLMCRREKEIRAAPQGKSKDMPRMFHKCFSGDPAYDKITLEEYANFRKK